MNGISFLKGLAIAAVATVVSAADAFALPYAPPSYAQQVFTLSALPGQGGKVGQISYDANGFNVPGGGVTANYGGTAGVFIDDSNAPVGHADIYISGLATFLGIQSGCAGGCPFGAVEQDLNFNLFLDEGFVTYTNGAVTALGGIINPVDGIFANLTSHFGIDVQGGRPYTTNSNLAFYLGINAATGLYQAAFSFLGEGGTFDQAFAYILNPETFPEVRGQFLWQATPTGAQVPEPASMALLGMGLLSGAIAKKRRANQA